VVDELQSLADLHRQGLLTDTEFAAAKARVLSGDSAGRHWTPPVGSSLRRRRQGWRGGVCAGLASATGSEAWLWRLGFVLFALFGGSGILAYLLMWVFIPLEPHS
jgi:phage shock protein PspC (stress-responsive transcriptional regulator)